VVIITRAILLCAFTHLILQDLDAVVERDRREKQERKERKKLKKQESAALLNHISESIGEIPRGEQLADNEAKLGAEDQMRQAGAVAKAEKKRLKEEKKRQKEEKLLEVERLLRHQEKILRDSEQAKAEQNAREELLQRKRAEKVRLEQEVKVKKERLEAEAKSKLKSGEELSAAEQLALDEAFAKIDVTVQQATSEAYGEICFVSEGTLF
jgi:hypothetical protein